MNARAWYAIGLAAAVILAFQFFWRYQYVHLVGLRVMRIDRLTGQSCVMPCAAPSPYNQTDEDAQIIEYIKSTHPLYTGDSIFNMPPNDIPWQINSDYKVEGHYSADGALEPKNAPDPEDYPVRLVCYCDAKMASNYWYEVKMSAVGYVVTNVLHNSVLKRKYGFK